MLARANDWVVLCHLRILFCPSGSFPEFLPFRADEGVRLSSKSVCESHEPEMVLTEECSDHLFSGRAAKMSFSGLIPAQQVTTEGWPLMYCFSNKVVGVFLSPTEPADE